MWFCLKVLLFLEKETKADNGSINQETTGNGHDHSFNADDVGVGEDNGEGYEGCAISKRCTIDEKTIMTGRERENLPMPMTTKKPVKKRPTSRTAAPELSTKSSGLAQRLLIQFGIGATM